MIPRIHRNPIAYPVEASAMLVLTMNRVSMPAVRPTYGAPAQQNKKSLRMFRLQSPQEVILRCPFGKQLIDSYLIHSDPKSCLDVLNLAKLRWEYLSLLLKVKNIDNVFHRWLTRLSIGKSCIWKWFKHVEYILAVPVCLYLLATPILDPIPVSG